MKNLNNGFINALNLINNSRQIDVVRYIFEHTDPSNNLYIGTVRATAESVGVSVDTTSKVFKKLQEADIMTRKHNSVYMIKPSLMIKGDNSKQHRLIIEYENIKQEQEQKKN